MHFRLNRKAGRDFDKLPPVVQRQADKQLELLRQNLLYPSLRAKKYDETRGIWQARVNDDYRFYFKISADTYIIISIIKHPK